MLVCHISLLTSCFILIVICLCFHVLLFFCCLLFWFSSVLSPRCLLSAPITLLYILAECPLVLCASYFPGGSLNLHLLSCPVWFWFLIFICLFVCLFYQVSSTLVHILHSTQTPFDHRPWQSDSWLQKQVCSLNDRNWNINKCLCKQPLALWVMVSLIPGNVACFITVFLNC